MSKYFTFSLFKSNRADINFYAEGAWMNYNIIKNNYKDFTSVFYIQENIKDNKYVKKLLDSDAEVKLIEYDGFDQKPVLWRFQPLIDGDFEVCFFRDCDSIITKREDNLIKLFLKSDKDFHVIKDEPHRKQKILAGMWGAKKTNNEIGEFISSLYDIEGYYGFEEEYFAKFLWDMIKNNVLLHDYILTPEDFIKNNDNSFIGKPYKIMPKQK